MSVLLLDLLYLYEEVKLRSGNFQVSTATSNYSHKQWVQFLPVVILQHKLWKQSIPSILSFIDWKEVDGFLDWRMTWVNVNGNECDCFSDLLVLQESHWKTWPVVMRNPSHPRTYHLSMRSSSLLGWIPLINSVILLIVQLFLWNAIQLDRFTSWWVVIKNVFFF